MACAAAAVVNLAKIADSIIWVDIIPRLCLGWFALRVMLPLVMRKRSPGKYEIFGRMANARIN